MFLIKKKRVYARYLKLALSIGTFVRKVANIRRSPPRAKAGTNEHSVEQGPSNASSLSGRHVQFRNVCKEVSRIDTFFV